MKEKHVIVCISNASDHQKAICLAADMAALLNARFSAVVADNAILREHSGMKKNIALAEKKGARIITLTEQDFALQSAEYSRISSATHIFLQEDVFRFYPFGTSKRLYAHFSKFTPNADIMVIPFQKHTQNMHFPHNNSMEKLSVEDVLKMILVLLICTAIGYLFLMLSLTDVHVIVIYLIGVLVIAMITNGRSYSLVFSVLSAASVHGADAAADQRAHICGHLHQPRCGKPCQLLLKAARDGADQVRRAGKHLLDLLKQPGLHGVGIHFGRADHSALRHQLHRYAAPRKALSHAERIGCGLRQDPFPA